MDPDELRARLTADYADRFSSYSGAIATFAFASEDGELTFLTCRWAFSREEVEPREFRNYPNLVLGEIWYDIDSAVDTLVSILSGVVSISPQVPASPAEYIGRNSRSTSTESKTGWPEDSFAARIRGNGSVPWGPVAAKGLRPYRSVRDAIIEWIWAGSVERPFGEVPYLSHLLVLVPDTRAKIEQADWSGDLLTVSTLCHIPSDELELQVSIDHSGSTQALIPQHPLERAQWELPPSVTAVDLFLVHFDGTLLSYLHLTRGEHYTATSSEVPLAKQVEIDLRSGEGDHIEYKPFIEVGDAKEWELVETIVAFANSGGGRLYVGVSDDGLPLGETNLRKHTKAAAEDGVTLIVERLSSLVRERVKPVPQMKIIILKPYGSQVILVDVPPSLESPHSTNRNDVYVRKGASNMKPDPLTELPALYRRGERMEAGEVVPGLTRRGKHRWTF